MSEEYVDVDGARLWTTSRGQGPGVVLAHGGPGMSDNLAPVSTMIEDLARVHRYDQRACGRSTGSGEGQTVSSAVADLEALRRHWGYERWTVGGHSWGAALALFYALRHPDRTSALLYISGPGVVPSPTTPRARSRAERLTPDERAVMRQLETRAAHGDAEASVQLSHLMWKSDFSDPTKIPDFTTTPLFAYQRNAEAAKALLTSVEQMRSALAEQVRGLRVPTLVVHGDDDPLPIERAEDLAGRLPCAELVTLEGVGHNPWLEDYGGTRVALRNFLTGLGGAVSSFVGTIPR